MPNYTKDYGNYTKDDAERLCQEIEAALRRARTTIAAAAVETAAFKEVCRKLEAARAHLVTDGGQISE
jgi:hypothetical protein